MGKVASSSRRLASRAVIRYTPTLEDIQACQISRIQLVQAQHESWFESFIEGAWVRCRAKGKRPDGEPLYKLYNIRGLHTRSKAPYNVEQVETTIRIKLAHARKIVGLPIDKVSNHPIQQKELEEYIIECQKCKKQLPSKHALLKQRIQILKYLELLPEREFCEPGEQDSLSLTEIRMSSQQLITSDSDNCPTDTQISPASALRSSESITEIRASWLGLAGLDILFMDFHIHPSEFVATQKRERSGSFDLSFPSVYVYLLCLSGDQRDLLQGTDIEHLRCCWPERGPLWIEINNTMSWIPSTLPDRGSNNPLDITPYICADKNTLKLVYLSSLEDYTFAICVYEFPREGNRGCITASSSPTRL